MNPAIGLTNPPAAPTTTTRPVLRCEDLAVGYPRRRRSHTVLRGVEITLEPGELACLLGPNGAGKSTLLRTLTAMQPPLAGRVLIDGRSLAEMSARDRTRQISVVLADRVDSSGLSGYRVVALGRHPHIGWTGRLAPDDHARVWAALEATGTTAFARRPLDELSDGERQRVMIARALAQDPRLIVLDEPTAFLDVAARIQLTLLLRDLARRSRVAVVLSTHDLDLALRLADTIWLTDRDGTVHAAMPEELLRSGRLAATFGLDGLGLDASSGTLSVRPSTTHTARVEGDGLDAVLARRALERLGYRVHATYTAAVGPLALAEPVDLAVVVQPDRWRTDDGTGPIDHHSLQDLARHARRLAEARST